MPPSPIAAPELSPALQWANAEPQALAAHRGRVLAVLFWNAASPYCHNLVDDLVRLQARFPLGLSILGVHLPKFDSELDGRLVLKAANRLGITVGAEHPVHPRARRQVAYERLAIERRRGRLAGHSPIGRRVSLPLARSRRSTSCAPELAIHSEPAPAASAVGCTSGCGSGCVVISPPPRRSRRRLPL